MRLLHHNILHPNNQINNGLHLLISPCHSIHFNRVISPNFNLEAVETDNIVLEKDVVEVKDVVANAKIPHANVGLMAQVVIGVCNAIIPSQVISLMLPLRI